MRSTVYVAGSRHERESVRAIQLGLMDMGFMIAFDWTGAEGSVLPSHAGGHEGEDLLFWRRIAEAELAAVDRADFVVAVMSPEGRGRGMFIEIGAALGQGKSVYLVGDAKKSDSNFWALDQVHLCKSSERLYRVLEETYC